MGRYQTIRLILRKKSFTAGIAIISTLVAFGALAGLLTPHTPRSTEIVASDFAVPEWYASPDTPRNMVKNFTYFSVDRKSVEGNIEVLVTRMDGFRLEIRGNGLANILLLSNDSIFYPYRPARRAQIGIMFNASYPKGSGEAWYNVEVLLVNEDLLTKKEKYELKVRLASGEDYTLTIPKGIYSVYDLVTTKVMTIYPYHRGTTVSKTIVSLPNSIRNIKQKYITSIADPFVKEAITQEFSAVNAIRELILEKNTNVRVAVNISYYCNPKDLLMNCKDGALVIHLQQIRVWIMGEAFGILGTNAMGNDVWTQFVYGSRSAIVVGITVATLANLISLTVGLVAGYRVNSLLDHAITFSIDVMSFIPLIPLIVTVGMVYGRSLWLIYAIIVLLSWQGGARIIRQWTISLRESLFVEAARALGASEWRILMKHLAPQLLPYLVYRIVVRAPGAVFIEASIQMLGFGDPEAPTWGRMINEAYYRGAFIHNAWWWIAPPVLGLILFGIGFVLIGVALDEIANPRLKR